MINVKLNGGMKINWFLDSKKGIKGFNP